MDQNRPCHEVGQDQPRFIICANLVGPSSPILPHSIPSCKGIGLMVLEKIFLKGFYLMAVAAILVM